MITIERLYEGRNGRALGYALYAVCALFLLSPGMDLLAAVLPPKLGNIQWRFGLMVSVAPTIMTGVISLAMFSVLGVLFGHRGVLRVVGGLSLVLAVLYVGMIGVFGMDLIQLKNAVPLDRRTAFYIMSAKCLAQLFTGAFTLLVLGLGSLRVTRGRERSMSTAGSSEGGSGRRAAPMVLGSRPSADNPAIGARASLDNPAVPERASR